MPTLNHSHKAKSKRTSRKERMKKAMLPLEKLRYDYATANRLIREKIRTELDTKFDALEDLDYPDVAILTVQGQPLETVAQLLDKQPTTVRQIQRDINALLAA